MPFVFLILGVLFLIVAIQGTQGAFFSLVHSEFTGSGNFVVFVLAIVILGALGYVQKIRPIADGLIGLVLLALVLNNKGGFFGQFTHAVANPVAPPAGASSAPALPATSGAVTGGGPGTAAPLTDPTQNTTVSGGGAAVPFELPSFSSIGRFFGVTQ